MDKLTIKCEELACLPSGNGIHTHVIFKADEATKKAIREAVQDGSYYNIAVKDGGGDHVTNRPHRFITAKTERSVIILTTQEL